MQHLEREMFHAVPVFDSAYPREFSRWNAQMDQLFMGSGYDISHARSILGIKLSGSARTNVLHNIRHAQSWAEIRATLVRELSDTPDVVDLIMAFRQLCQNGGPIQDYNAQFHEFLFRTKSIMDTDNIDLLQRYCDGLDNEYEAFHTKQIAKMCDHTVHLSEIMDCARKFTLNSKIVSPSAGSELQVAAARTTLLRKRPAPCADDNQQQPRDPSLWCDFHQCIGHNNSTCCSNRMYCPQQGCRSPVKMDTIVDHYRNSCKGKKCGLCGNNRHDTVECPNRGSKMRLDEHITLAGSATAASSTSNTSE